MISPPRPPTLADLLTAIQNQNSSLQQLVNLLPGLIHQKAVPLKIYGLAASGSQNKVIIGSYQARRIVNIQLDSSQLYSGGQKLREIWSGFDTDQPFVINMSAVNITIAFDDGADPTNEVITIPAGYVWWQGMLLPGTGLLTNALLGTVRIQDGTSGGLLALSGTAATMRISDGAGTYVTVVAVPSSSDAFVVSSQNGFQVNAATQGFNGATWDRLRTPNIFKPLNAVNTNAEITIWTPAAGKKFRLMGYQLDASVAGNIILRDNTAGATIVVVPSAAGGPGVTSPPMGNGILSAAANNVLTAQAAAASTLSGIVYGTEE